MIGRLGRTGFAAVCALIASPVADASRPAPPGEPTMMAIAVQNYAPLRMRCYEGAQALVSTVDRDYAALTARGNDSACNTSVLLRRSSGDRWAVVKEAPAWYCNDRYAPRTVVEDLFDRCIPTTYSSVFVTPDGGVTCVYHWRLRARVSCYARAIRTVAVAYVDGQRAQVRQGILLPAALRDVRGPVLIAGGNWETAGIRCRVSRTSTVTCTNTLEGAHSSFRAGVNSAQSLP